MQNIKKKPFPQSFPKPPVFPVGKSFDVPGWKKVRDINQGTFIIGLVGILVVFLAVVLFLTSPLRTSNTSLTSNETPLPSQQDNLTPLESVIPPNQSPQASATRPKATPTPKATIRPTPTATPTPTPTPTPQPGSSTTGGVSLSMDPAAANKNVNQIFAVTLNMDTKGDQVSGAKVHISFDGTKLEIQSITAGTFLPIVLSAEVHNNVTGTASITLGSSPGSPATGTGNLATVTFKAKVSGSGAVNYDSATETASVGKSGNSLGTSSGATITIN